MRVLILTCFFIITKFSVVAQTKESSQEHYFTAKENFNGNKYSQAISNLALSEKLEVGRMPTSKF